MYARVAKEEIALLMPSSLSHYADEPRMMPERTTPTIATRIGAALRWVAEMPRRRAVLSELCELSDHELADIGLNRAELHRVFDPDFAAQRTRSRTMGRALIA